MGSNTCLQCLSRLRITNPPNALTACRQPTFPSATSLAFPRFQRGAATQVQKKGQQRQTGPPQRKTLKIKNKGPRTKSYKRPAEGERKAIRKRVVLSNTNAFEVTGLMDLNAQNFTDPQLIGKMVGIPGNLVDSLRAVESFKASQGWGFFRRPATLLRKQSADLAAFISSAGQEKSTMRRIITGAQGTGKSVLLLQAHAMAFLKGWTVLHIPEGQDLTIATTAYDPVKGSEPKAYAQRTYIASLLGVIAKANPGLNDLTVQLKHDLPQPLQNNISLLRLAETGSADPDVSYEFFQALWAEITAPGRPPILFTLDGLAHVSRFSEYLAPSMHYIHAHDLTVIRHFISCLNGKTELPNGGMVLAAENMSNRPANPTLDFLTKRGTQSSQPQLPAPTTSSAFPTDGLAETKDGVLYNAAQPYENLDQRTLRSLRDVSIFPTQALDKDEAKTVLEYYARSGMLRAAVTEALVAEKWTLSGGGVIGELERGAIKVRL